MIRERLVEFLVSLKVTAAGAAEGAHRFVQWALGAGGLEAVGAHEYVIYCVLGLVASASLPRGVRGLSAEDLTIEGRCHVYAGSAPRT